VQYKLSRVVIGPFLHATGRPALPGQVRDRLAGAELWSAGDPGGDDGHQEMLPPGAPLPRPTRIEIRIGRPLEFGHLAGEPPAQARRVVADKVMRAIGELSGQEYVHLYASDVKTRLAAGDGGVYRNLSSSSFGAAGCGAVVAKGFHTGIGPVLTRQSGRSAGIGAAANSPGTCSQGGSGTPGEGRGLSSVTGSGDTLASGGLAGSHGGFPVVLRLCCARLAGPREPTGEMGMTRGPVPDRGPPVPPPLPPVPVLPAVRGPVVSRSAGLRASA
jgi:hypothetical protein